MSIEASFRVIASLDDSPIELLNHNPVRLENRALVSARKIRNHALGLRVCSHDNIPEVVRLALHIPDCSRNGSLHFDRLDLVPTLETTMRFQGEVQQFIHL